MIKALAYRLAYKYIKIAVEESWISKLSGLKILNLIKYNGILMCELCKEPLNPANPNRHCSIDHIIPTSKGGLNNFDNLRLTHRICNAIRGNNG